MVPPILLLSWTQSTLLAVIWSLASTRARMFVVTGQANQIVERSRFVEAFHVLPAGADDGMVLERLERLAPGLQDAVLLPLDERGSLLLIQHRAALARLFRLPPLPDEATYRRATDKASFAEFMTAKGFPHPRSLSGTAAELALHPGEGLKFPLMLKPSAGLGGVGIVRCESTKDLKLSLASANAEDRFVLQEWVDGPDVDCSFLAHDGRILAWTTQRSFAKGPNFAPAPQIRLEPHEGLVRLMERLAADLHWSGLAHVDTVWDERDGKYRILELNGRPWGTLLASTASGVNFPARWLELSLRRELKTTTMRPMRFYTGGLGLRRLVGRNRFDWSETDVPFVMRDPGPTLTAALWKYARYARKPLGRWWPRR